MNAPDSGWWRDRAACASPEGRALVDASYDRPGGSEAQDLKRRYCRHCPAALQCLGEAMEAGEYSVWGGTSPNQRTRAGSRSVGMGRTASVDRYGPISV